MFLSGFMSTLRLGAIVCAGGRIGWGVPLYPTRWATDETQQRILKNADRELALESGRRSHGQAAPSLRKRRAAKTSVVNRLRAEHERRAHTTEEAPRREGRMGVASRALTRQVRDVPELSGRPRSRTSWRPDSADWCLGACCQEHPS